MITVVAALVAHEGRVLICQRRRNDKFPLKWEFPGGKVRQDESLEQALARELHEELGVAASVGAELYRTRHRYAEYTEELELVFFAASLAPAAIHNLAFEQVLWAEPAALAGYDFLPADRELIALLASGKLKR